jgi:ferritin-like metal-binding protein YciE
MENETKVGMNRTGMQMAPFQGPSQVDYAMSRLPHPEVGSEENVAMLRGAYVKEALRVGSVPVPATGKGLAETAVGKLKGNNPEVLFDKLGERAAYERSGVRLYQAVIAKVQAVPHAEQTALLADLEHICSEELQHFHMLAATITELGGDPTAQTPCADISAVASMGMIQVVTDPRTTLAQCLQALLSVELTDNACWELLIELADQAGHEELVPAFQQALASEQEHETLIRQWLRKMVMEEAT